MHTRAHLCTSRCIAMHRREGRGSGENVQELNESVTARVFFYDSVFRRLGWREPFLSGATPPEQRAVNHYLFLYFTLSSGGERNERGSDGTERVGKKGARESGRKSEGRGCFGERRALE